MKLTGRPVLQRDNLYSDPNLLTELLRREYYQGRGFGVVSPSLERDKELIRLKHWVFQEVSEAEVLDDFLTTFTQLLSRDIARKDLIPKQEAPAPESSQSPQKMPPALPDSLNTGPYKPPSKTDRDSLPQPNSKYFTVSGGIWTANPRLELPHLSGGGLSSVLRDLASHLTSVVELRVHGLALSRTSSSVLQTVSKNIRLVCSELHNQMLDLLVCLHRQLGLLADGEELAMISEACLSPDPHTGSLLKDHRTLKSTLEQNSNTEEKTTHLLSGAASNGIKYLLTKGRAVTLVWCTSQLCRFKPTCQLLLRLCHKIEQVASDCDKRPVSKLSVKGQNEKNLTARLVVCTLDSLYELARVQSQSLGTKSRPDSEDQVPVCFHLSKLVNKMFLETHLSYLSHVCRWLEECRLGVKLTHQEFFVLRFDDDLGRPQLQDMKLDWDHEFGFREWSLGGRTDSQVVALVPKFLKGMEDTILDAGKSQKLALYLKTNPRSAAVGSTDLEAPSFYTKMIAAVSSVLDPAGSPNALLVSEITNSPTDQLSYPLITRRSTLTPTTAATTRQSDSGWSIRCFEEVDAERSAVAEVAAFQCALRPVLKPPVMNNLFEGISRAPVGSFFQPTSSKLLLEAQISESRPLEKTEHGVRLGLDQQLEERLGRLAQQLLSHRELGTSVHFSFTQCCQTAIQKAAQVNFAVLGKMLNISFDVKKLMKTAFAVFLYDSPHCIRESFTSLMSSIAEQSLRDSREQLQTYLKDLLGKVCPELESSFEIVRSPVIDKSRLQGTSKVVQLTDSRLSIKFTPPYPLKIVFSETCLNWYNSLWLLFTHLEAAKWTLSNTFKFLKGFKRTGTQRKSSPKWERAQSQSDMEDELQLGNLSDILDDNLDRLLSKLVVRLMAAANEYSLMIHSLESLFRRTVLGSLLKDFFSKLEERPLGLTELSRTHELFVRQAAENCCLTPKGDKLLEIFFSWVKGALSFGQSVQEMERALECEFDDTVERLLAGDQLIKQTLRKNRQDLQYLLGLIYHHHKDGTWTMSKLRA